MKTFKKICFPLAVLNVIVGLILYEYNVLAGHVSNSLFALIIGPFVLLFALYGYWIYDKLKEKDDKDEDVAANKD